MAKTTPAVKAFISAYDSKPFAYQNLDDAIEAICCGTSFRSLILALVNSPAFSEELSKEFAEADAIAGLSACRNLRSCLNFSISRFFGLLAEVITAFDPSAGAEWKTFSNRVNQSNLDRKSVV